tara:strand:- start:151 stop:435 length:285 start_codon:yes stop_codon:yes gene_type:complete
MPVQDADADDEGRRWQRAREAKGDAAGIRLLRSLLGDTSHDPEFEVVFGPAFDPWVGPEPIDFGPTLGEFAARRLEVLGVHKQDQRTKRGKRRR